MLLTKIQTIGIIAKNSIVEYSRINEPVRKIWLIIRKNIRIRNSIVEISSILVSFFPNPHLVLIIFASEVKLFIEAVPWLKMEITIDTNSIW